MYTIFRQTDVQKNSIQATQVAHKPWKLAITEMLHITEKHPMPQSMHFSSRFSEGDPGDKTGCLTSPKDKRQQDLLKTKVSLR